MELIADLDGAAADEIDGQAGVCIPRPVIPEDPAHWILLEPGDPATLRRHSPTTIVQVPHPDVVATSVAVLAASRLAALREAQGILTFHATAVATPTGAVLLAGPQMAGKTSIALEVERRYGWSIVSTNTSCVRSSTGELTAGSAGLTVRGRPEDPFRLFAHGTRSVPATVLEVVGIADVMPGPSPLWADDHHEAAITLHRYAAEWPRLVTTLTRDVVDAGLDTQQTAQRRWGLVQDLISRVRCLRLSGPATEIAEWIGGLATP